jgi:hypothetical protein
MIFVRETTDFGFLYAKMPREGFVDQPNSPFADQASYGCVMRPAKVRSTVSLSRLAVNKDAYALNRDGTRR